MTFYLASKYGYLNAVAGIANVLENAGHVVTSRWLQGNHSGVTDAERREYALEDLEDIYNAKYFVVFEFPTGIPDPIISAGRNIEFGYAYATDKHVIIVGPRHSVFHFLPGIEHYEHVTDFLEAYT